MFAFYSQFWSVIRLWNFILSDIRSWKNEGDHSALWPGCSSFDKRKSAMKQLVQFQTSMKWRRARQSRKYRNNLPCSFHNCLCQEPGLRFPYLINQDRVFNDCLFVGHMQTIPNGVFPTAFSTVLPCILLQISH